MTVPKTVITANKFNYLSKTGNESRNNDIKGLTNGCKLPLTANDVGEMSSNVVPFPSSKISESQGGVCSTPPIWPNLATSIPAGGFDSVRLEIPWPLRLPFSGGFVGVDEDGVMSEVLTTKFNKMRLESWRGGWAYKPLIQDGEQFLILEGSPAKAATGQNLYLPETEGLARAVFRGVRPFMLELRERCGIQLGYDDFSSYFYQCLVTARVQRIDLTSMFKFPDTAQAEAFIAFLDVQRSGIYYKGDAVKRWRRESDTSLSCGSGRRWRAKFYLKQPEMTVAGHCPRLKVTPELWEEADGVGRFEWEHRSENMLDDEKAVRYWTGERIREARLKFWSKVFIPGVPYRAAPRYRRIRKEVDLTPKMAALKLEQFMANLSEDTKIVLNERPLGVLREMFESLYVTKNMNIVLKTDTTRRSARVK